MKINKYLALMVMAVFALACGTGCITYYHKLPEQAGEPGLTAGSDNVFFARFIVTSGSKPDDGRIKSSNIKKMSEFRDAFIRNINMYGSFRDTAKSNYTAIIDFRQAGRIGRVNFFASLGTLTLIPLYDRKTVDLKISVFHKSGEPVKEYIYSTGHVEWTGCVSFMLAKILFPASGRNVTYSEEGLSYKKDAELIFSSFIKDFNSDFGSGVYKENRLADIEQNPVIRGIVTSGSLADGFSTIQVRPGVIFKGDIKNGLPNGIGSLTDNGTAYYGTWINGKLTGKGKITYRDGSWYSGMLLDSRPHGYGKLVDGESVIEGEWKDGKLVSSG